MKKLILFLSLLILVTANFCSAQNHKLDSAIQAIMANNHIPGLSACAIDSGRVSWTGYYGYQNIEEKKPVNAQTLFAVASTSKTVTAAALMQLYGEGRFKMDDDVNKYLPFKVRNPNYPEVPITFGELLRHRSSINDNIDYLGQFWYVNKGDPTIALGTFLKDYLSADGKNYDAKKNFFNEKPDSAFHYCNVGIALVGYLVERISGMPFDKYCKQNLFVPLEMNTTAWFIKDLDSNKLAMPYDYNDTTKRYKPLGFGGYPDYPAGSLHTTSLQFANFLIAWTQDGKFNHKQIFKKEAIKRLTPNEYYLGYYLWFLYGTDKGNILYTHTGGDSGINTFIGYSPKTKKGIIFLMNGTFASNNEFRKMIDTIYDNTP